MGDLALIPGSGRSPVEGNANPLQYYCLGNPMDKGAWQATVHGVAKSATTKQLAHSYDVNAVKVNLRSKYSMNHED